MVALRGWGSRWPYAPALLLALLSAGIGVYTAQVAWFTSRSQRLAEHGRTAPGLIVRVTAWGAPADVPTESGVRVRPALRAKILYDTGPRVLGAVVDVSGSPAVRDAQRRHGELIMGTPLKVVYDPAHPGVAEPRTRVTPAPGRAAAAGYGSAACALAALAAAAWTARRRRGGAGG